MTPSTNLRFKTMIRSLTESILPAIDPNNAIAQEQAKLLIGHLHVLLDQDGNEKQLQQKNMDQMRQLALTLLNDADGGPNIFEAAKNLTIEINNNSYAALSLATEKLILADDATDKFKQLVWLSALDFSKSHAEAGKSWFKMMGF